VARDRGLPRPRFQWLEVPALDHTMASPSMAEMGEGMGLTREAVATYRDRYLPDPADRTDPRASPLLAEDLSGLAPAIVVTAELDPVRDDGERYVARLHAAGVPAVGLRVLGHPHGTWIIPVSATWRLVEELRTTTLRLAFAGDLPGI
jgi:acetyl esterase